MAVHVLCASASWLDTTIHPLPCLRRHTVRLHSTCSHLTSISVPDEPTPSGDESAFRTGSAHNVTKPTNKSQLGAASPPFELKFQRSNVQCSITATTHRLPSTVYHLPFAVYCPLSTDSCQKLTTPRAKLSDPTVPVNWHLLLTPKRWNLDTCQQLCAVLPLPHYHHASHLRWQTCTSTCQQALAEGICPFSSRTTHQNRRNHVAAHTACYFHLRLFSLYRDCHTSSVHPMQLGSCVLSISW